MAVFVNEYLNAPKAPLLREAAMVTWLALGTLWGGGGEPFLMQRFVCQNGPF